jgi:hypothetical protein
MSASGIQLAPLVCLSCNGALSGEQFAVFLYCEGCGSGFEIKDENLKPVRLFFGERSPYSQVFLPFWVFEAQLTIKERESRKSLMQRIKDQPKGLSALFAERGTIRFYAPAFEGDVELDKPRALQLTYDQPNFQPISKKPQLPNVVFGEEDARKLAEFLFLKSEIEQPDTVRKIDYQLSLQNPYLLVAGFLA